MNNILMCKYLCLNSVDHRFSYDLSNKNINMLVLNVMTYLIMISLPHYPLILTNKF